MAVVAAGRGPAAAFRAVPAVGLGERRGEKRGGERERGDEGLSLHRESSEASAGSWCKRRSNRLALLASITCGGEVGAGVAERAQRGVVAGGRRGRRRPRGERPGFTPPRRGRSPRRPRSRPGSARSRARAGPRRGWGSAGSRGSLRARRSASRRRARGRCRAGRFTETLACFAPFSTIRTRNHVGAPLRAGGAASARGGGGSSAGGRAWATCEEPTAFFTSWRSSSARSAAAGAASAADHDSREQCRLHGSSYSIQTWMRSPSSPSMVRISAGPVFLSRCQNVRAS